MFRMSTINKLIKEWNFSFDYIGLIFHFEFKLIHFTL